MKSFFRTLRTSLRALRRNITRSLLTCLGIIIGIAAVIAMVEIGQGTSSSLRQTIASIGANVIQVDPADMSIGGINSGAGGRPTLTPADADAIRLDCGSVKWVAPSVDIRAQIVYGRLNWSPNTILGTTPDYFIVRNWEFAEGAPFTYDDIRRSAGVCIMGETAAHGLFGDDSPLGKEIRVRNVPMTIVGVLRRKGANMMGRDQDDMVVAPWTTIKFRVSGARQASQAAPAATTTGPLNALSQAFPSQTVALYPAPSTAQLADTPQMARFSDIDDIWVSAASQQAIPDAISEITGLLRERHRLSAESPNDFRTRDLTEVSETLAATSKLMTRLLLVVALISLVVGGVGIMNIMLVSVTERTREIGLRLAVGAQGKDILRQFLLEAVLLCLAGGIAGILLGRAISITVTALLHWPTVPSLPAIIAAVGVSATVGIVFGYYPAWRASRLDPIEALRYE